ncbi:MAG: MBOAT family protein [Clostridia bacterium]|nr:MBOAT family protein [Clostridia bacterium]
MVFSSLVFLLLFFPLVLILNFSFRSIRAKNACLCAFSLLFYAWGEPLYLFLMLLMVVSNYLLALGMQGKEKKRRLPLLIPAVLVDVGAIAFFKYGDFALVNLEALLGVALPRIGLALPIGISFFTFQIMSYTIDVYRGEVPAQKSLLKLTTYVALFPQLVAGPIVRYQTVAEELDDRKETLPQFTDGLHRFIWGLGKKVIFANGMAMLADTVFAPGQGSLPTLMLWLAAIAYALQIYFDFSGYSDMAIGMGKMFGFHFLENFDYPYRSRSITEFWRRWHISLGSWFRDYVYIPLGGNRVKFGRMILNMLVVWGLTGLWHGANWNFILWGLYYFLLLLVEKLLGKKRLERIPAVLRHGATLLMILLGWILFRIEDMGQLGQVFAGMFTFTGGAPAYLAGHHDALYPMYLMIPACIGCLPVGKWLQGKLPDNAAAAWMRAAADVLLFALCIFMLLGSTYNPFIYFRF